MRILITGSSGQLGSAIARRLAGEHTVLGLDVAPGPHTTHLGSVADRACVRELLSSGIRAVIHTASLHAPHVARQPRAAFVEVNVQGTLNLLEAAAAAGVDRFVYTSTTSLYGHAMVPRDRAVWVTESLAPRPRDIYDITKIAAEQLCLDVAAHTDMPVLCLRTSRFWNESPHLRAIYRLYRGVDVDDAVDAHLLALHRPTPPSGIFNISALSPFQPGDTADLLRNARAVIHRYYPQAEALFRARGWPLPERIDRVYVIDHARDALGYAPRRNFDHVLRQL